MVFKRKFEIGDKVKVIKTDDSRCNQIGEITHYYSSYGSKGVYSVSFENGTSNYYPNELEKVEDFSNTNTKSNKLLISDLKPGMKVRIRPDLKEGYTSLIYVSDSMTYFKGTIQTIKTINSNNTIILNRLDYLWDINCFSEIVEESEEETEVSEKIELPLKEGQVVTLLDGKEYKVMPYKGHNSWACEKCSLFINDCSCQTTYLNETTSCTQVINNRKNYFKLLDSCSQDVNKKSTSLTISDFKVGMKVRVKENFDKIMTGPDYISNISTKMRTFKGKELIIENIENNYIIAKNYCWIPEWLEIVDESTNSSNSVENSSVKEMGIITKVNFTLTDFKSEKLEHSKFTIL